MTLLKDSIKGTTPAHVGKPSQRPKVMTEMRALTLAIRLCKLEIRRMSWDRNAYHKYGGRYPEAVKAATRSEELERVIGTLEGIRLKVAE